MTPSGPAIRVSNIRKTYGSTVAVDDVSFEVVPGEIAVSGLFFPVSLLPAPVATIARVLPLTAAASLLNGIWLGDGWAAHGSDVVSLVVTFVVCTAVSSRVFRWE